MILLQTLAVPQFEWNKKHVVRHVRVPAGGPLMPVSYTHLTLPTILLV